MDIGTHPNSMVYKNLPKKQDMRYKIKYMTIKII